MASLSPLVFFAVLALVKSVNGQKKIFCNWDHRRNYISQFSEREANLCTHLVYHGATLDSASLTITKFRKREELIHIERIRNLKLFTPGLKTFFKLGTNGDSRDGYKYSRLVSNATSREHFASFVVNFMRNFSLDGFIMDWRYPKCWRSDCSENQSLTTEPDDYLSLLKALKEAFIASGLQLSLAVAMPDSIDIGLQAFNYSEINKVVDFVFLKLNQQLAEGATTLEHLAPFQLFIDALTNAHSLGIDKKKLIMDIPFYGRSFRLLNPEDFEIGSESIGKGFGDKGKPTFGDICKLIIKDKWNFDYIIKTENYSHDPAIFKGDQWSGFDDCNQVYNKTIFVVKNGFGGVMVKDLSRDDHEGTCFGQNFPLLRTINSAMNTRANPANRRPKCDLNQSAAMTTVNQNAPVNQTQSFTPPIVRQESNINWFMIIGTSSAVTFTGFILVFIFIWLKCRPAKIAEQPELKPKSLDLGKFQSNNFKVGNSYESIHLYEDLSSYEPKCLIDDILIDTSNHVTEPCYYNEHTYLEMQNVHRR